MPLTSLRPGSRYALAAITGGLMVAAAVATGGVDSPVTAACTPGAVSRLYLGQTDDGRRTGRARVAPLRA